MTPEEITEILRAELKPKRFAHTMGVMATARELAEIHGESEILAQRAGLLHDNAKSLGLERMLELADEGGLELSGDERASAALMHAPVGAYLARVRFGEEDARVLDAIRYHTTGRPGMSALEAIIYLADMIEPNRADFEGLRDLRSLARRDLSRALEMGLYMSNSYVLERGQRLFDRSRRTYEWIKRLNDDMGRNANAV
ncbi:MAG: bis(5'-nucleosyl)-tetraphosphatase (symmetrical) YqeK [Candidatus Fimadaptatus sp.]